MSSPYRVQLQIMHEETGIVVAWVPRKPETDGPIIDNLCARLEARMALSVTDLSERVRTNGVGLAKTEAHVIAGVRAACDEVNANTVEMLRQVWQDMLRDLKAQV